MLNSMNRLNFSCLLNSASFLKQTYIQLNMEMPVHENSVSFILSEHKHLRKKAHVSESFAKL